MPLLPGAPKLPKSDDQQKVYNTGYLSGTNPVLASPGMANSVASSADLELYRRRREAQIQRGEDPGSILNCLGLHSNANELGVILDAAAKSVKAKHQARKDAVKGLFGLKKDSSKGNDAQPESDEITFDDGAEKAIRKPASGHTDSVSQG